MSFEVDRYSSAWAHIALCADLTWATEPPDEFIIANQRLWAQHCRVNQVLQDQSPEPQSSRTSNQCEVAEKRSNSCQIRENGNYSGRRNVKDVIPESRLARFYGNFYYDEEREKYYTSSKEKTDGRAYSGPACDNSDVTECWMLPEVEYWFRKLVDEPADRNAGARRRRQYRAPGDDDFERWGLAGSRAAGEEAALAARVRSVRGLWAAPPPPPPRRPSPPPAQRKIRARRRQPRRLAALAPPPPAYCLEAPAQLFCDPSCKFQFDPPRPPQLTECQRAMGRLSASVQAVMRASAARCPPYRGTTVSRYAPVCQRPLRCAAWPPRGHRYQLAHIPPTTVDTQKNNDQIEPVDTKQEPADNKEDDSSEPVASTSQSQSPQVATEMQESPRTTEKLDPDPPVPSTSAAAQALDISLRKKRLYSTVLSMSAPNPLNLAAVGCVRLSQKLVPPGLIKLSSKLVLPSTRMRPIVDNKFEELEKEALEQYKASDESIDTKFHELEKEAVEQYSNSNSNTSCSSGRSAEKRASASPVEPDPKKQPVKFHKDKAVGSVVIYSQNFPDLNAKGHTTSVTNLKNFHTPPRGEKKEQTHRSSKSSRSLKCECQRAASDTDYDTRESRGGHKGAARWALHAGPPKKRHLTMCVSDCSSDEDMEAAGAALKDAGPRLKHVAGKIKMSAHGGGDLHTHPLMRKT